MNASRGRWRPHARPRFVPRSSPRLFAAAPRLGGGRVTSEARRIERASPPPGWVGCRVRPSPSPRFPVLGLCRRSARSRRPLRGFSGVRGTRRDNRSRDLRRRQSEGWGRQDDHLRQPGCVPGVGRDAHAARRHRPAGKRHERPRPRQAAAHDGGHLARRHGDRT